jgi:predicted nucleic acid-binding protein
MATGAGPATDGEREVTGFGDAMAEDVLLDTSAAIPLVLADHELHAALKAATAGLNRGLAGHAWFETYSVLTRLPAGHRQSPTAIHEALVRAFPHSRFLDATAAAALGPELARLGIAGGAVFDALVGAAARHHGVTLLSCDRRAQRTYDALGVRVRLLG